MKMKKKKFKDKNIEEEESEVEKVTKEDLKLASMLTELGLEFALANAAMYGTVEELADVKKAIKYRKDILNQED